MGLRPYTASTNLSIFTTFDLEISALHLIHKDENSLEVTSDNIDLVVDCTEFDWMVFIKNRFNWFGPYDTWSIFVIRYVKIIGCFVSLSIVTLIYIIVFIILYQINNL